MNTGELLLKAVLADPADDLPRLVYADWLDENGEPERAEFIRVGCQLAKLPGHPAAGGDVARLYSRAVDLGSQNLHWATVPAGLARRYFALGGGETGVVFRRGFVAEVRCDIFDWCGGECQRCDWYGHMYDEVDGPEEPCLRCDGVTIAPGIGPQIVAEHPVERVVLTDCEPISHAGGWRWGFGIGGGAFLPQDIYLLLPEDGQRRGFATRTTATQALSVAAIKWANLKFRSPPARGHP